MRLHLATVVCCLALLNKQITGHSFPPWDEAIRIELSSVLSQPRLIENPQYRSALARETQREIVADPWATSMTSRELVNTVIREIETAGITRDVEQVLASIFESDFCVYSVLRRGLAPIRNADVVVAAVDATSEALDVEYEALEDRVRTMYYGLFRRLA
jgi:hypothetical protein